MKIDLIPLQKILQDEIDQGLSQTELAKKLEVTDSYVSEILGGKKIGNRKYWDFVKKLSLPLSKIFVEGVDLPTFPSHPIPVISWVAAGKFYETIDIWPPGISGEGEPVYSRKRVSKNTFALRVKGDSMAPRFHDGDIIIVDPSLRCDTGCFCVVKINEEVTFKKFYENETEIRIISLNEKYPEMVIKKGSPVAFKVIGKVVDMIPKL